jgi:hypothetical protein
METQTLLRDGVDRGHFKPDTIAPAEALAERSLQVSTKLLLHLKTRARQRYT